MEPKAKYLTPSVGDVVEVCSTEEKGEVVVAEGGQVVLRHRDGRLAVCKKGDIQTYLGEDFNQFRELVKNLMNRHKAGDVARHLWQEGYRSADQVAEEIRNQVVVKIGEELSTEAIAKLIEDAPGNFPTTRAHAYPGTRLRYSHAEPLSGEVLAARTAHVARTIATLMCSPVATPQKSGTYHHAKAWMDGTPAKRKIWEAACEVMSIAQERDVSQAIGAFIEENEDDF